MDSQGFKFQNNLNKRNQIEINVFRNLSPFMSIEKESNMESCYKFVKIHKLFPISSKFTSCLYHPDFAKGIIINGFPEKGAFNFISDYDRVIALKREYYIFLRHFLEKNFLSNNQKFYNWIKFIFTLECY